MPEYIVRKVQVNGVALCREAAVVAIATGVHLQSNGASYDTSAAGKMIGVGAGTGVGSKQTVSFMGRHKLIA